MHPNGTTTTPEPSARPGERIIEFSDTMKAALADHDFVLAEYNRGGWVEYEGEYIAVVDRVVRAHGMTPKELRAKVSAELGIPPGRVAVDYIPHPKDFSGEV